MPGKPTPTPEERAREVARDLFERLDLRGGMALASIEFAVAAAIRSAVEEERAAFLDLLRPDYPDAVAAIQRRARREGGTPR